MKKLYVAGPMTGYDDFNYPAFEATTARLRAAGYEVCSPHEVNPPSEHGHEWAWYMRRDIAVLVECEAVATLDQWWLSRGAMLEVQIAGALGMPIWPADQWAHTAERGL